MEKLSDRDFERLVTFVRERYGINLEKKRELIISRLSLHIAKKGYQSFTAYLDTVMKAPNGQECQQMIDRLSTNHTFFFRETDCLQHITTTAVPELLQAGTANITIWCAAASSGQECYSLAMQLDHWLRLREPACSFTILGSDINRSVLEKAEKGIYDVSELVNIPERFIKIYTKKIDNNTFTIVPELKRKIKWQNINLVQPFNFRSPFDLILCRNVMIYFPPALRENLIVRFAAVLRNKSYFYVGTTESIDNKRQYFRYVAPSIYRKI